jgi:hypothetical protein
MRNVLVLVGASLVLCCASSQPAQKTTIADTDFARLTPDQTAQVDKARQNEQEAKDDLARAQLRTKNADHEADLVQADAAALDADRKKAEADNKLAQDTREPAALNRAQKSKEAVELHEQANKAHQDYATKLKDATAAEENAAQARVDTASAKAEKAKLSALSTAGSPVAQKYDKKAFEQAVADAEEKQRKSENDALQKRKQAVSAQRDWNDQQAQLDNFNRQR